MRTNQPNFSVPKARAMPAKLQQAQLSTSKPVGQIAADGFQAVACQSAVQWPCSPTRPAATPLIAAAIEGDTPEVRRILDEAVANPEKAKRLLKEGPNWIGVLEAAAREGNEDVVKLLLQYWLQHPALRHQIIKHPGEALAVAAEKGQQGAVKMMLEAVKEHPELKTFMYNRRGNSPLHYAVANRRHEVASLLIEFATQNPELAEWVFHAHKNSLRDAVCNFDDEMIRIMMTTKHWRRFADVKSDDHPRYEQRIEEAIKPYLVDL